MRFLLRLVALFCFFAAAVIVYGWFGVHDGPDPGGLVAVGTGRVGARRPRRRPTAAVFPAVSLLVPDVADSTGEAWDVFGPIEPPSATQVWVRFGLIVGGCAVAGLALGYFAAAVIADRILHR